MMEFSDEYSTFQIKPLKQDFDFSTDFAGSTFKYKRKRSRSSTNSGSKKSVSVSESVTPPKKWKVAEIRRICLSLTFLLMILIAIVLPHFQQSRSEDFHEKYLTDRPNILSKAVDSSNTAEALNSLHAALEMKRINKNEKARKLFLHAVALSPHNARVLLHYGQFLEEFGDPPGDLIEADHQYTRAMAFSLPGDTEIKSKASEGKKRTATKVDLIDEEVLKRIDQKKRSFLKINRDSDILRRVKQEAYVQYIYHTVGIEGNTMNLAQTRSILETKLAVGGKSIMEHNEILGMDSALKYINNTLVDKIGDITLENILEIHKRVLGNVEPGDAGTLRKVQVFVGDHVPPPPWHLDSLLAKFVWWLNSGPALSLHPVRLAALAHYKLVHIHPWLDGNGRTSRLLMNVVLMQSGFPPVIIRRADREVYYQHLVTANEGDIRPFVRFIAHCTENTLDAYLWASKEYHGPPAGELEGEELPYNLLEHSLEQVNTQLTHLRGSPWLNFDPLDERIISGEPGDSQ